MYVHAAPDADPTSCQAYILLIVELWNPGSVGYVRKYVYVPTVP